MKLAPISAAIAAIAIPAAPAFAHCGHAHHSVHRVAWHAPVRQRAVRFASACGCASPVVYHRAVYPVAYPRPRIVEVTYERPRPFYRPFYRPHRIGYAMPLYRPRPIFYRAGFERPFLHRRWSHEGFYGRPHRWGGWR